MDVGLAALEAVVALDDHGSFTRAASALGRTQSAVSRAVAGLERQLGGPLAHRGRARDAVTLTTLGREVVGHARAVRAHLDAVADLATTPEGAASSLRLGAILSATTTLVPAVVAGFTAARGGARVWLVQGDDDELAAWFADGTVDVVVTTWPADRVPAPRHRQRHDEFLAVLPARHRLAGGARVGLRALVEAGVADPGGTCGPQLAAGFVAHGESWAPAHVVRDTGTVLAMAAAGITVGVLPALAVPDPPPPGIVLRPLDPPLGRTVHVHHRDTPAASDLADLLASHRAPPARA